MSELFTIKPLEWKQGEVRYCDWWAETAYHTYVVYNAPRGWRWIFNKTGDKPCDSPEEGKRLAEEHWREYVKQALIPVGSNAQEASVTEGER